MNIPDNPSDWSYNLIETLTHEGYLETDYFDFKGELTAKDPKYNENLTKISSAFANTRGGFIIFGILDLDLAANRPRIAGIAKHADLAKEFGEKIRQASPRIFFDFGNPPISVPNSDKVLFVVHIPQSSNRPHMTPDGKFWLRTNEGNRQMTYEEVREAFLHYEERRYKLKLLYMELLGLKQLAEIILNPRGDMEKDFPMLTMDSTVINSIIVDVYTIIQDDVAIVRNLLRIRQYTSIINSHYEQFRALSPTLATAGEKEISRHTLRFNTKLTQLARSLEIVIDEALSALETRYSLTNPFNTPDTLDHPAKQSP